MGKTPLIGRKRGQVSFQREKKFKGGFPDFYCMINMVEEYEIREARTEDHGAIYDFSLIASKDETVPQFLRNAGEFIVKKIEDGKPGVIVAFHEDELVGILDCKMDEEVITIKSIYVRKDHRRKGLASILVNKLEKLYPGRKKQVATAVTEKGKKFWESNGFVTKQWILERDT